VAEMIGGNGSDSGMPGENCPAKYRGWNVGRRTVRNCSVMGNDRGRI